MYQLMNNTFSKILLTLRKINRKRLELRKVKAINKKDLEFKQNRLPPIKFHKIFIMHTQPGWGDFLYFSGLVHILKNKGIDLVIGTTPNLLERFRKLPLNNELIDVTKKPFNHINKLDCIVDLDWNITKDHNLDYIKFLNCWAITCSSILKHLNIFDQYIDISGIAHISNRYKKIAELLLNSTCEQIFPLITFNEEDVYFSNKLQKKLCLDNHSFIYLNTVGSSQTRTLSHSQIDEIIKSCLDKQISILYYSPTYTPNITDSRLISLPTEISFCQLALLISKSIGIISPDTSIVHLASAFNIPALAIYCSNDYDCFGNHLKSETWSPLSKNSIIVDQSDKSKIFAKFESLNQLKIDFYKLTTIFLNKILS